MKTISLAVYKRPEYLERVLDSLSKNDWTGYTMFIAAEYNADAHVLEMCHKIDWIEKQIFTTDKKLGCTLNTYRSIDLPFANGSDFNIYWEDDVLASPTLYHLANWFAEQKETSYSSCLLQSFIPKDAAGPTNSIIPTNGFSSHGFFVHRRHYYQYYKKYWLDDSLAVTKGESWDFNVGRHLWANNVLSVQPTHPYSQHIGVYGTHSTKQLYDSAGFSQLELCTEKPDFKPLTA